MLRLKQIKECSSINTAASTASVATFAEPVEIISLKLVCASVGDANTAANVRVDRREKAGNTSANVTSAWAGAFVIPTNVAQGSVLYTNLASFKELKLEAGDQLAFNPVNVSTNAATVIPVIEFVVLDEPAAAAADAVLVNNA